MTIRRRRLQNKMMVSHQVLPFVTKQLGSLWVIRWFLDRLGIPALIDQTCPVASQAGLSHGEVIAALVANRLTAPRPLHSVEKWAAEWAVTEVFGIEPAMLNDDRLSRALDAIYPHLDQLKGSVAWSAIEQFGIDTSVFHWDFTSLSFFGAYDDQAEDAPQVTWGHVKGHAPAGLKQVMLGLAVSGDGAIPFNPTPADGSTAEVSEVVRAMMALKAAARRDDFTLVGDTKLISRKNVLAACEAGIRFCGPAPAAKELDEAYRAIPREEFRPLSYASEREDGKPVDERTAYLGAERSWELTDPKGRRHVVRRVFVISAEEQAACRKNRARQMEKAEAELSKVQKNLGTRWYDTPEKVREKANGILRQRRVTSLYRTTVGGEAGAPTFHWERDEAAIAEAEARDGFYVLVTNLPADPYDASAVLQLYKGQYRVERRFGDFKGPLGVTPIFLKDNRRIASLVFVVYLALLIFSLLERQARRALENPEQARWEPLALDRRRRRTHAIHDPAESGKIRWAVGEPAQRPTGANILERLRPLLVTVLVIDGRPTVVPPQLDPALQKLHELLGVPMPFSS